MPSKGDFNKRIKLLIVLALFLALNIISLFVYSVISESNGESKDKTEILKNIGIDNSLDENSLFNSDNLAAGSFAKILSVPISSGSSSHSSSRSSGSSSSSSSNGNSCAGDCGIGSPDEECKDFGFDFGVAKWECEGDCCDGDSWKLDEEIYPGTSVTGCCSNATWSVGSSVADGIIVKAGNIEHGGYFYAVNGTSGNVILSKDISHITFCGYEDKEECGNDIIEEGEECEHDSDCEEPVCDNKCIGNDYYEYEATENNCDKCSCEDNECEIKNINYNDTRCLEPKCGDGKVDAGEECDDGNTINEDECSNNCEINKCIIKLNKTESIDPIKAGEELSYYIEATNTGTRRCTGGGVQLKEYYDSNTIFLNSNPSPTSNNNLWNFGILEPGEKEEITINMQVNETAQCGEILINKICIWAIELSDWQCITEQTSVDCPAECGDGKVDAGEECDDGDLDNFDECRNDCTLPYCGDLILDLNEECEPPNTDTCDANCKEKICKHDVGIRYSYGNSFGTGIAIKPENGSWLDDPVELTQGQNYIIKYYIDNKIENSTNNIHVIVKIDGNILADYNTSIDEYKSKEVDLNTLGLIGSYNISVYVEKINEIDCNLSDNYAERPITIIPLQEYCGDGNLDAGEECDLGSDNGKECTPGYDESCTYCSLECENKTKTDGYCGDEIINGPEECEFDYQCNNYCIFSFCFGATTNKCVNCMCEHIEEPKCGDGIINQIWEECDDGNLDNGDGCDNNCTIERECTENSECDNLDRDYCYGSVIKHDEGICVNYECKVNESEIEDCGLKDGITGCGEFEWDCSEEINQVDCVITDILPRDDLCGNSCIDLVFNEGLCNPITYQCEYTWENCSDGNTCTEDICNTESGCSNPPEQLSTPCEADDLECTTDHCDGYGNCVLLEDNCDECCDDGDCLKDIYSDNYCYNNDIYFNLTDYFCKDGKCLFNMSEVFVKDCGEDYCDSWGNYYCEGKNRTRERTCYDNGCSNGNCFNNSDEEKQTEECTYDCVNGECTQPECGDGNLDAGEECDLGINNGKECTPGYDESCTYCSLECENKTKTDGYCGDEIINGPEECEFDYQCNNYCIFSFCFGATTNKCVSCKCEHIEEPKCGDGIINQIWEECDDGNNVNGDGCDKYCKTEGCPDTDHDCVCDQDDKCLNSKPGEMVNEDGCDPFQFCGQLSCGDGCSKLDFIPKYENCVPIYGKPEGQYPGDCTTVIVHKEGIPEPRCTPTTCAD